MSGPYSIEEIEEEIHQQVVSSKAREGEIYPGKFVMLNMEKNGFTRDDYVRGTESLNEKGLVTDDGKIAENFFQELGGD